MLITLHGGLTLKVNDGGVEELHPLPPQDPLMTHQPAVFSFAGEASIYGELEETSTTSLRDLNIMTNRLYYRTVIHYRQEEIVIPKELDLDTSVHVLIALSRVTLFSPSSPSKIDMEEGDVYILEGLAPDDVSLLPSGGQVILVVSILKK